MTTSKTGLGLRFVEDFLRGRIAAFPVELENSEGLSALSAKGGPEGIDLESAVMELAHGSCHSLTFALAARTGQQQVICLVDPVGFPVHSAIYNPETSLILDANGVHTLSAAELFWSKILRAECKAKVVGLEFLENFAANDEEDDGFVMSEFDVIASYLEDSGAWCPVDRKLISSTCGVELDDPAP